MGIDNNSILVFGWNVNGPLLIDFLTQNKVGTCCGWYVTDEAGKVRIVGEDPEAQSKNEGDSKKQKKERPGSQCFCRDCWDDPGKVIPEGVYIVKASPYYDCGDSECSYAVSLINKSEVSSLEVKAIPAELIDKAREFARRLRYQEDASEKPGETDSDKARRVERIKTEQELSETYLSEPNFFSLVDIT